MKEISSYYIRSFVVLLLEIFLGIFTLNIFKQINILFLLSKELNRRILHNVKTLNSLLFQLFFGGFFSGPLRLGCGF
jgi:hypothetical protein